MLAFYSVLIYAFIIGKGKRPANQNRSNAMTQVIKNIFESVVGIFAAVTGETTDSVGNIKRGEGQPGDYIMIGGVTFIALLVATITIGLVITI